MIVDLVRNDLGRVCEWGSVAVPSLLRRRVTSGARATWCRRSKAAAPGLRVGRRDRRDVPAGLGHRRAEARRARHIRSLEPVARGVYCGAVGWVDADAAPRRAERGHPHVLVRRRSCCTSAPAAAITWDSTPGRRVGRDRAEGAPPAPGRQRCSPWVAWHEGLARRRAGARRRRRGRRSVLDHGLTVGDGVFETMKVVDGDRVRRPPPPGSAAPVGARPRADRAVRRRTCCATRSTSTIAANHPATGRVRLTVTGGAAPLGSGRGDGPGHRRRSSAGRRRRGTRRPT